MAESWKTKWGVRRVRHDPPTLTEAFAAAACLTEDRQQQAEIAADLMGIPVATALAEAGRLARSERSAITVVAAAGRDKARPRTVVIERRAARRASPAGAAPSAAGTAATPAPGTTLRLPGRPVTGALPR